MHSAQQLSLFSRSQECGWYLSPGRPGYFSTLTDVASRKRQRTYPLSDMVRVIEGLDSRHDTWCTQAEFFTRNRRLTGLARIDLQFIDLDTYQIERLENRPPQELVQATLQFCSDEGILAPSILVFSGRGLQAKWFLERPVPRRALPRWNAVQRALVERLAPLGADAQARDASRVLRLVNTVNTKSGKICRVVHVNAGADGRPVRYNFEQVAQEMLPMGRQELEGRKREWAQGARLRVLAGSKTGHLRRFSGRQLAWDRLEDLRRLVELRGGARQGERMKHLFWQLNFLLLSGATNSRQMYYEATALARDLDPRWGHASAELMTLYRKAKEFEAGERVEFGGKRFPPLYTPKNVTLISLFEITDAEQRQMGTLISCSVAAERHRLRDETRRRASGVVERQIYLGCIRLSNEESVARHRARDEARRREAAQLERQAYLEQVRLEKEEVAARHRARDEARRREADQLERQTYLEQVRLEKEEVAARHRARDEARRREADGAERQAYLKHGSTKQKKALELRGQELSIRDIAKRLNCSKSSVSRYLKGF